MFDDYVHARQDPPPLNIVFMVISPAHFRLMLIPALGEKIGFVVTQSSGCEGSGSGLVADIRD